MKALSKKLLSWLCVMAMVLSLVPAVALPASATENEIQYGTANLPAGVQDKIDAAKTIQDADLAAHIEAGSCPICGEGVTWQNVGYPGKVSSGSKHFVVTDDTAIVNTNGQWCDITGGTKTNVCLALMNTQPKTINGSIGFRGQDKTDSCTFNVMGSGTLISNGSEGHSYGLIWVDGKYNSVNLYGGTFVYTGTGLASDSKVKGGAITFYDYANYSTVNIYDGVNIGPETQDTSTQCYNVVVRGHSSDTRQSTINMYGGTIRNGVSKAEGVSGNVYMGVNGGGRPIFNMYGGTISNGTYNSSVSSQKNGGNVLLKKNSKFNMYGGTVTGGKATNGGNFYVGDSYINTLTISGGTVQNGTATYGGNIYGCATVLVKEKALIQNGISSENAANIYFTGNSAEKYLQISGGKISGGTSTYSGGSIFMKGANGGYSKITGGIIEGATAGSHGGNIYLNDTVMQISGATISDGTASKSGGNIYLASGTLTLNGATVSDGIATEDGGNICANSGTLNVNATISGGSAENGGSIYLTNATTNITGGTISGGVATGNGGNIYHTTKDTVLNISNVTVSGGKANYGGNLSQHLGAVNITGATFENGEASNTGGNINAQGGTVDMTNTVLTGGKSGGNGSNLRVYNMTVNMVGGAISGGIDKDNAPANNVYLVRSDLNMSGAATVTGDSTYGSAIRALTHSYVSGDTKSTVRSNVILADNASILGGSTALALETVEHADGVTGPVDSTLVITEGWNGTASVWTADSYTYGDTVAEDNITVGTYAEDGTFTKGGTFAGTLKAAGLAAKAVEGDVVLAPAGIILEDGTRTSYWSNDEALAAYAYNENAYLVLTEATATIPETVSQLNVEILGKEITFTGNAKIYGSDNVGSGKLIVAEGSQITVEKAVTRNSVRYIALENEGAYTFHTLALGLNNVALRTSKAGIYYKAELNCDQALKNEIASYGVALSVEGVPTAAFETEEGVSYTQFSGAPTDSFTSGSVFNIFRSNLSAEKNAARGEMKIYAKAYVKLADGTVLMSDNEGAYSLQDVMSYINENFYDLGVDDQASAKTFYSTWTEAMASWNLETLAEATVSEA